MLAQNWYSPQVTASMVARWRPPQGGRVVDNKMAYTHWLITNDYGIYNLIEKYFVQDDSVIELVEAKFYFTDRGLKGILDLYEQDNNANDTDFLKTK